MPYLNFPNLYFFGIRTVINLLSGFFICPNLILISLFCIPLDGKLYFLQRFYLYPFAILEAADLIAGCTVDFFPGEGSFSGFFVGNPEACHFFQGRNIDCSRGI